jgi:hypothetical protein
MRSLGCESTGRNGRRSDSQPAETILERSAELAVEFRARREAVVLINVAGIAKGRTSSGRWSGVVIPDGDQKLAEGLRPDADEYRSTKFGVGERWCPVRRS